MRARRAPAGGSRPIRVGFLTPSLSPGGAERQQLILARLLPKPTFEVRFIAMLERGGWAAEAESLGARVDLLGLSKPGEARLDPSWAIAALRGIGRYRRLVGDVDIVDAWLAPAFTFAALAQPVARVPVVLAGRRSLADLDSAKSRGRRAAAAWATRRADAVVANSRAAADEVVARDHVDPDRVIVIPNAVLPIAIDRAAVARQRLAWGFGVDDVVVGCVANYKTGKGLEGLLKVAATVRHIAPSLRFVLVGDGPLRAELAAAIDRHEMRSVAVLHGRVRDARSLYGAFDVAVQTSTSEGLPNAVLEAAAAGLPIVATNVGGTAEIIDSDDRGILIRPGDPRELAAALLRLAGDPKLRKRLGDAALERSAEFSGARLSEATASLYLRLLGQWRSGRT